VKSEDLNSEELVVVANVFVRALDDSTLRALASRSAAAIRKGVDFSNCSRFGLFHVAASTPEPRPNVEQINAALKLCESCFWTREEASRGLRPVVQIDDEYG
jgi:hypothetical protein